MKFEEFRKEYQNNNKSWQQILSKKEGVNEMSKRLARNFPGGGFANMKIINGFINKYK